MQTFKRLTVVELTDLLMVVSFYCLTNVTLSFHRLNFISMSLIAYLDFLVCVCMKTFSVTQGHRWILSNVFEAPVYIWGHDKRYTCNLIFVQNDGVYYDIRA